MAEDDPPVERPRPDPVPPKSDARTPEQPAVDQEDFARMLEESLAPRFHQEGDTVEGTIVALGTDVAFVDIGGKGEATIDIAELKDPDGDDEVKVGDTVQAIVVSTAGGVKLSYKLARGAATRQRLNEAFEAGLPVEGRVEKSIKGGYEVRLGGQRAFCPISQIDTAFTEDPSVHDGQVYTFLIIEFKEDGKDLVVSRRAFLKEEEQEVAGEIRRAAVPGAVLPGRVASVRPYGAFIDLGGGIQGLLHVSEMGWSRVADPAELVRPGDEITVKVLRVDEQGGKIALGLKQLQSDPWSTVEEKLSIGRVLTGKVERHETFGVFVFLAPGLTGLVHHTETGLERGRDPRKAFPVGSDLDVVILEIDPSARRIQLSRKAVLEAKEKGEAREYVERQDEAPADRFGSLADKLRAAMRPPKKQ